MEDQERQLYTHYAQLLGRDITPGRPLVTGVSPIFLDSLTEKFHAFFFDGFGTLYNLHDPYPGAREALQYLRNKGCALRLITNAASRPPEHLQAHLQTMGLHFEASEIISSGSLLAEANQRLGIRHAFHLGRAEALPLLRDAGIEPSSQPSEPNVIITSGIPGSRKENAEACEILRQPGAKLIVLNPDAWAPRWEGGRIPVSGTLAWDLIEATGCTYEFFGKPFSAIFHKAIKSIPVDIGPAIMVGDTLGTDVLGAHHCGLSTALILGGNTSLTELYADETALQVWPDYYLDPRYLP